MKVVFLKDSQDNEVFAYFPFEEWCNGTMSCYAHIGQHSACHPNYANSCKEAKKSELIPLLNELVKIGYDNLEILTKKQVKSYFDYLAK
jgi:hypothetical protein